MHMGGTQAVRVVSAHPQCEHCGREYNPRDLRRDQYLAYEWDGVIRQSHYRIHYYCSLECAKYYMTPEAFYYGAQRGIFHRQQLT